MENEGTVLYMERSTIENSKIEQNELLELKNKTIKSLSYDIESGIDNVEAFEAKTKLLNVILCAGEFMYSLKSENVDVTDLEE